MGTCLKIFLKSSERWKKQLLTKEKEEKGKENETFVGLHTRPFFQRGEFFRAKLGNEIRKRREERSQKAKETRENRRKKREEGKEEEEESGQETGNRRRGSGDRNRGNRSGIDRKEEKETQRFRGRERQEEEEKRQKEGKSLPRRCSGGCRRCLSSQT